MRTVQLYSYPASCRRSGYADVRSLVRAGASAFILALNFRTENFAPKRDVQYNIGQLGEAPVATMREHLTLRCIRFLIYKTDRQTYLFG